MKKESLERLKEWKSSGIITAFTLLGSIAILKGTSILLGIDVGWHPLFCASCCVTGGILAFSLAFELMIKRILGKFLFQEK